MILKELINQVQWQDVAVAIVTEYPWCRRSLEGFRGVFETLLSMESIESEYRIKIENRPEILNSKYKHPDVVGIKEGVDERWALSFCQWKELLGMVVCQETLDSFSMSEIVANCLFDMTFFGFTEELIEQEKQKLERSINESEEHPEDLIEFKPEDFHVEISMKGYLRCLDRWLKWGAIAYDYYGKDSSWFKAKFLSKKAPEYYDELERQTLIAALKEVIREIEDVAESL